MQEKKKIVEHLEMLWGGGGAFGVDSPPAEQKAWNISWVSLSKVTFCVTHSGSIRAVRQRSLLLKCNMKQWTSLNWAAFCLIKSKQLLRRHHRVMSLVFCRHLPKFHFFVCVFVTVVHGNQQPVLFENHNRIRGQASCKLFKVQKSEEKTGKPKGCIATLTLSSVHTRGTCWTAKTNMLSLLCIWSQTWSSVCPRWDISPRAYSHDMKAQQTQ